MRDFSLEITSRDVAAIPAAAELIPAGTRINVTFLSNEEPATTVAAARAVLDAGFVPVPHLAARRIRSLDVFMSLLEQLQAAGVAEHLFLIAGDPAQPEGPFSDAASLIRAVRLADYGVREVGIAGYPEGHPNIATDVLWASLDEKLGELRTQGLAPVVVTQFGFDADAVATWVGEVRARGYDGPIRVGAPGPAGVKRLLRYASRFGVTSSAGIVRKYGFSLANLMGTAGPDTFIRSLQDAVARDAALGEVAMHFYTFGGLDATAAWARDFVAASGGAS
ncbi:methylenetetrahydrofolate reductase [Gulosibacter sp. ACHW.36C]|uniref:Methylenetetrahydrofolate reductase n=1 Tax=Gulosibacter sediminis TaxID=1729695 RepID=A0ABY4MY85_9MICO|nr:methylenetetrahydrofolate reductase [Gulosibacter sediminis]UQN14167.1 methylenetetrahydrofolate reductase [Gulosibacter sediminis]